LIRHEQRAREQVGAPGDAACAGARRRPAALSKQNGAAALDLGDPAARLREAAAMLGLGAPGAAPAEPVVEYVEALPDEWRELTRASAPLLDGGVALPRAALARMGARLAVFRPFGERRGYSVARVTPAVERAGDAFRVPPRPLPTPGRAEAAEP